MANDLIEPINNIPAILTIDDFINRYLSFLDVRKTSKVKYKNYLEQFLLWLKGREISHPARENILEFKQYLQEKQLKETTISAYLKAVKRLFEYLAKTNQYENIAFGIKQPLINTGFKKLSLSVKEAQTLLFSIDKSSIIGKRDYAVINLILHTGLRLIEVLRADTKDIKNEGENTLLYVQGKGHDSKDAFVILTPSVIFAINDYLNERINYTNQPLFISHSKKNTEQKPQRLSTTVLSKIISVRLKESGLDNPKITPHSLRHTAITFALMGGANLQEAKELARHTNMQTTLIYAHNIDRVSAQAPEYKIEEMLKNEN